MVFDPLLTIVATLEVSAMQSVYDDFMPIRTAAIRLLFQTKGYSDIHW